MVRGDDRGEAAGLGPFAQRGIARGTGVGLEIARWRDKRTEDGVGNAELAAQCCDDIGFGGTIRAQAMIDGGDLEATGDCFVRQQEQGEAVGTTRNGKGNRSIGSNQGSKIGSKAPGILTDTPNPAHVEPLDFARDERA